MNSQARFCVVFLTMFLDQVPQVNLGVEMFRQLGFHESPTKPFLPVLCELIFDPLPLVPQGAAVVFCSRVLTPVCRLDLAFIWDGVPVVL